MTQTAHQKPPRPGMVPLAGANVLRAPSNTPSALTDVIVPTSLTPVDGAIPTAWGTGGGSTNIDGGSASSTYLDSQIIDGGDEA